VWSLDLIHRLNGLYSSVCDTVQLAVDCSLH